MTKNGKGKGRAGKRTALCYPYRDAGSAFASWRRKHGWTQAAAAEHLGVAVVTLRHWESGYRRIKPSVIATMALLDRE